MPSLSAYSSLALSYLEHKISNKMSMHLNLSILRYYRIRILQKTALKLGYYKCGDIPGLEIYLVITEKLCRSSRSSPNNLRD